jgi:DNA-directed RNA polymerase subunit K/omega
MNYLDLVEEYHTVKPISQFEKVLVMADRARDIYEGKTCKISSIENRKPTTQAQYELLKQKIEPDIYYKDEAYNEYGELYEDNTK